MTVYIKSHAGFPMDEWGVVAFLGFRARGASIKFFEDIETVPRNRDIILLSYIDETRTFFKDMGYKVPEDMSFPESLRNQKHLWKRDIEMCTAKEIEERYIVTKGLDLFVPFFCKPANVLKGFQYGIIKTIEEFKAIVDTKMDVIVSEVIDFVSEYRCFIIDKKIVSCQHYLGDLSLYPSFSFVESIVAVYKDAPIGYSIDVGITNTGHTALIECNDGWSLGSYGCMPKLYTRLLSERWLEILKQNPVDLSDILTDDKLIQLGFIKSKRSISAADMWQGCPVWTHKDCLDKTIWGSKNSYYYNESFNDPIYSVNQLISYLKRK